MGIVMLRDRRDKAARHMNLDAEDLISSLLWSRLRMLDPNVVLRRIINQAVNQELIRDGELDYKNVVIEFWKKLRPPPERSPQGREHDGLVRALLGGTIGPPEGKSEADVYAELGSHLSGRKLETLLLVEMKLHAKPSRGTSHDPERDQSHRMADVLWYQAEVMDVRRFVYVLFDAKCQPDTAINQLRQPAKLKRLLPYRDQLRYPPEQVAKWLGWTNYRQVRDLLVEVRHQLKTTAEQIAVEDALVLLEDVVDRTTPRRTLFPEVEARNRGVARGGEFELSDYEEVP